MKLQKEILSDWIQVEEIQEKVYRKEFAKYNYCLEMALNDSDNLEMLHIVDLDSELIVMQYDVTKFKSIQDIERIVKLIELAFDLEPYTALTKGKIVIDDLEQFSKILEVV